MLNYEPEVMTTLKSQMQLISKNGYRVPDGYSDAFRVLAEQQLLCSEGSPQL